MDRNETLNTLIGPPTLARHLGCVVGNVLALIFLALAVAAGLGLWLVAVRAIVRIVDPATLVGDRMAYAIGAVFLAMCLILSIALTFMLWRAVGCVLISRYERTRALRSTAGQFLLGVFVDNGRHRR